ncbi:hypothetical protein evm_014726 [Chilo suppressalis]|nr:hypothetical protein evm_014726 [Chilo suppressalis]
MKMAAKFVFFCASALFIQSTLAQSISFANSGINVVNSGINSIGIANSGIGSAGLVSAGLGKTGLISSGLAGAGVIGAGFSNSGLIGAGLGNSGLIGASLGSAGVANTGLSVGGLNFASSGPLVVTTISPIGPSGLAVASENVIEGALLVSGSLPFLSAVSFEGALPTAGSGVATCGCGNGAVGIISEGFPAAAPAPVLGIY